MNRFRHSPFLPKSVSPLSSVREESSCTMRYWRWNLSVTQVLVRHSAVPRFPLSISTRYRRTSEPGNFEALFAYELLYNPRLRSLTPKGRDWFYKCALKQSGNVMDWRADPKSNPSKLLTKKNESKKMKNKQTTTTTPNQNKTPPKQQKQQQQKQQTKKPTTNTNQTQQPTTPNKPQNHKTKPRTTTKKS